MGSLVKTKLRIGKICYTNSLPFFHSLQDGKRHLEFYEHVPAQLNLAMRRGKIDIAPISSLEYLKNQKKYYLLPDLGIGARDFSESVLLFSKERIEGLDQELIALPEESLSSSSLLKILLAFKYRFTNEFITLPSTPEEMLKDHTAALLIGDKALFYESDQFIYKYDLSELWWNWTDKPFCFAVWAVRKEFAEGHPEEVKAFYRRLRLTLERNLMDLEKLVREALGIGFLDKGFSKVFGYLFNLNYGLDPSIQEGLELFYQLAYQLKIAPRPEKLQFFPVD